MVDRMRMQSCTYFAELGGRLERSEEYPVGPSDPFSGPTYCYVDGKQCEIGEFGAAIRKTTHTKPEVEFEE